MQLIGFVRDTKVEVKQGKDGKDYDSRSVNIEGLRASYPGDGPMPVANQKIAAELTATYLQPTEGEDFGRTVYKIQGWVPVVG